MSEADPSVKIPGEHASDLHSLDVNMARARVALSLLAMLSLYIDPTAAGGLFHLSRLILITLVGHLAYSVTVYLVLRRARVARSLTTISTALDLLFAAAVAFLTEGQTSPSYVFFVFAIIAAGIRPGLRQTVVVTILSVIAYLVVILVSDNMSNLYMMRAGYLAIAGCLIGFVGRERALFELEARKLEVRTQRLAIARSLHDGYVQALAGMNLRLETCRELLARGRAEDTIGELDDLQKGVAREYDEVRTYIRGLAGIDRALRRDVPTSSADPRCQLDAMFAGPAVLGEHILQIMLEGVRNARRHGQAEDVIINLIETHDKIFLKIDDNGVGFADAPTAPWAIASRVAELGGHLSVVGGEGSVSLTIELPNP
jgi:signal transduction histidine kinase